MPILTREELYERVWNAPVRTLAAEMGVSDVWLKKCCVQAHIPVPNRGYWTKLRAGKPVLRMKLPPRGPGEAYKIGIGNDPSRFYWPLDPERELADPPPEEPHFPEPLESVEERIRKAVGKVAQCRNLKSPHLLIRKLLDDDEQRRFKTRATPARFYWTNPFFDSPFERRRLRVLNAILTALTKAGYKPWLRGGEARELGAKIGLIDVHFRLDHPSAKPDRNGIINPRAGKIDTLKLSIGNGETHWIDKDDEPLEQHLTEIVVQLILRAERILRSDAQSTYERALERRKDMEALLIKQRAEALERERQRRIAAEEARRATLVAMAADHRTANDIRGLVASAAVAAKHRNEPEVGVAAWASWALAVADRMDPIGRMSFDGVGGVTLAPGHLPEANE